MVLVTRTDEGYAAKALMPAFFIPCIGVSDPAQCCKVPTVEGAWSIRSIWLAKKRLPDETAVAVYKDLWFSNCAV